MRKLMITSILLFFSLTGYCQNKQSYCEIYISGKGAGKNCYYFVNVNYGNNKSYVYIPNECLKDTQGNTMKFYSKVDVFNYFRNLGWEVVTQIRKEGDEFLLKKEENK